jgi:uncharacterized NAD(P)/FAD-binding protein YdhS
MLTFAIIGGGFSGTVTAAHLLRRRLGAGSRVILINRSGAMARGVAYGTQSDHHVLNVPAGRMSAFDHDADSFVRFVRQHGVHADGGTFVSRRLYGAYLEWLLDAAAREAPDAVLERITAETLAIEPADDGTHAWLSLSNGSRIRAERVVLATGNYQPEEPRIADPGFFRTSQRYVPDPWSPRALAAADGCASVLLLGTGLTMVDIVLELRALGMNGVCVAISRRGLLPISHRVLSHEPERTEVPPGIDAGTATVRGYLRAVRRQVRDAAARGVDWRDVIASLRPLTPRLWQALSIDERRRFLRHLRPFWDVHRHRLAPLLHEAFTALRQAQQVTILAGRILEVCDARDHVVVRLRPRGSSRSEVLTVGAVINCTGPTGDTRYLRDALFNSLHAQGVLRPDVLGLGIETSPTKALIGADGRASSTLYYIGPFAKAGDWEATAVPELRRYASQLVDHLLETLPSSLAGSVTRRIT